ncbi:MAG: cobalamin-dependent protein [Deltaproteobacteria bacterium]|nr:MAG: cobalamin-dependent protein [Deltaproteobacteria bacterium]
MRPRVLLTSVFKPFGIDNIYSRKDSKIELYHNQLTKFQGIFSLRQFHDTFGLHVIANNIEAPTIVLDFPTLERFRKEVKKGYDIIGIGSIMPNFQKVKRMVEEAREISPNSKIVLGGFCATIPDLEKMVDVDYICVGEGISFMRDLLGLPSEFKFKNPDVFSQQVEIFGVPILRLRQPEIIPGLGCSYGCDFCSVTHFFGRRHIKFYKTGRELFEEVLRIERRFHTNVMGFLGEDNFLLDLKRANELRKCVIDSGKAFNFFIFSSADLIVKFGIRQLAEMGVGTIWIGRESKFADYKKNENINMADLVDELRSYGIRTILSSILLLDQHTRENIEKDIDDHLACRPTISQFAFYSPTPKTPLYDRMNEEGRILTAIPFEEWHAFKQPWFIHPEFNLKEAEKVQEHAYQRDFLELGPWIMRFIEAEYNGWLNLKDSYPLLQGRAEVIAKNMWIYRILLLATEHLAPTEKIKGMCRELREKIEGSFGSATIFERAVARGLQITGRLREFRTRHWGDALQPRTRVKYYNC